MQRQRARGGAGEHAVAPGDTFQPSSQCANARRPSVKRTRREEPFSRRTLVNAFSCRGGSPAAPGIAT